MGKVGLFVFGDIGRSPRMQNHAQELSYLFPVFLLGYFQSSPRQSIMNNQNIHLVDLKIRRLEIIRSISYYLYALIKIIVQILQIWYLLGWKIKSLDMVLVQNPPSIPNLFAIWAVSKIKKFQFWIDFHNYGYTILALNIRNRFILKIAQKYEKIFARKAKTVFCVSKSMKNDLYQNWAIQATVLYDRPRNIPFVGIDEKIFFQKYNLQPKMEDQLLLVSSTSWTKDEDFSILLRALELYDGSDCNKKITTLITGKGPQKQKYLSIIKSRKQHWKKIKIQTIWLQADDYPILLSLCDLGISLHYSSSGLDLPMKVVDMFAANLPVLAIEYPALQELVRKSQNGFVFSNQNNLFYKIKEIVEKPDLLKRITQNVQKQKLLTWSSEWQGKVKPKLEFIK